MKSISIAAAFNYGKNKIDRSQLGKLGFAGFRVHFPLNVVPSAPGYKDELVSFLGASYFRALGQGQRYGASARGLAIDTAERSGEEFPRFEQFWIERPASGSRQLVIYALLDSRRVTGAYRFTIRPGEETVTEVQSRLYLREPVAKLALAPLTSMYFFGENQRAPSEDYRPEVHDSDGLAIHTADWRVDLAAAGQSAPVAGDFVCVDRSARLWTDAARPKFQQLRRSGGSL